MAVPSAISELSTTPGSNPPSGADSPSVLDDHLRTVYAFIKTASDAQVALTGNQTIAGVKTFSSTPVVPDDSFTFAKLQNVATATILGRSTSGTGDIEALTPAQAAAIVAAASTTAQGVVELATDAEAQAGTDTTRAVTPDNLGATVLGIGQAWQDVAASRAVGTTYTNTTGRPIAVNLRVTVSGANSVVLNATVDGVVAASALTASAGGSVGWVSFIVPSGATYVASISAGTPTVAQWAELR